MVSAVTTFFSESSQLPYSVKPWIIFKAFCAKTGFWITFLISVIVVFNQYESLNGLNPFYRITMPALCLAFSFITTAINIRLGIISCIFALPLLPNLTWQIQQYFGYGRILSLHNAGFDLMAGLFLGALANQIFSRKKNIIPQEYPWQAGLVILLISASTLLAISRNLHQSVSLFQFSSLLYNLTHLRSIDWHDDYRPLFDWIAYGCAFSILTVVAITLKSTEKRNDIVFKPLIISLIIAAIVGYRQSKFGMGLSLDQINFRVDRFGYMALGFQHDIHAFAGQMLIGSIGLFGYLYYTKQMSTRLLVALAIPICWIALFLSKSKSNFVLSVVCFGVITLVWVFRHSSLIKPMLKAVLIFVFLIALSAVFCQTVWISFLTYFAHSIGLPNIEALNIKLSYRPEVYWAALKMFSFNPMLGLGQSEFYRQAANYGLTNSHFLSIDQNGENAHNYFLQTLSETGLIGITIFAVLIFYPIWYVKDKRALIPAGVGLGAIFIGNIFAHSMLVRENLFIAAALIGLMYAWVATDYKKNKPHSYTHRSGVVIIALAVLGTLTVREIYLSYRSEPFLEDVQCFKARQLDRDGWTSGIYKVAIPLRARAMTLHIKGTQPDVSKRPLAAQLYIVHHETQVIQTSNILFTEKGPQNISIAFPEDLIADDGDYQIILRLHRCFIPKNMSINADGRRLGIQIESSTPTY